jgi:hypothetical protein
MGIPEAQCARALCVRAELTKICGDERASDEDQVEEFICFDDVRVRLRIQSRKRIGRQRVLMQMEMAAAQDSAA